ncbi:glycoside hydrolase family 3 protein [Devosia sp.]
MIDLQAAPFNLDDEAIAWVEQTLVGLSTADKISQLFVLLSRTPPEQTLAELVRFKPGGITRIYSADVDAEIALARSYIEASAIPPLISADLEGSRMSLPFGTIVPNPLGLASVNDVEATEAISTVMAEEARAMGLNWSFTPVIDINKAFRSAIVGTRSYGSDIRTIHDHAMAQIGAFQRAGVAATVKHWPGEGYDDRDQHLVTTVNPLSLEEWDETYGRLYAAAIGAGVMAVMTAHIAFPGFVRELDPDAGAEAFRPATLSPVLNIDLLRDGLGFNGLIVSDATPMAGFGDWGPREQTVPEAVMAGCDVILFSDDPDADVGFLHAALADGRLTAERLDAAVTRILGLKAALKLQHRQLPEPSATKALLARPASRQLADQVTARVPTLVKDVQNLLPLDPKKHKRILIYSGGIILPFVPHPVPFSLPERLKAEGFEVTLFQQGMTADASQFDLVLYLFGEETTLTRSRIFLDWTKLTGSIFGAMHRLWYEVPTLMISFGYPYYLYDAPRVPTYINAYGSAEPIQAAVLEALVGRAEFSGSNPIDPFCGSDQGKY